MREKREKGVTEMREGRKRHERREGHATHGHLVYVAPLAAIVRESSPIFIL
jgi:hypothetical protein